MPARALRNVNNKVLDPNMLNPMFIFQPIMLYPIMLYPGYDQMGVRAKAWCLLISVYLGSYRGDALLQSAT